MDYCAFNKTFASMLTDLASVIPDTSIASIISCTKMTLDSDPGCTLFADMFHKTLQEVPHDPLTNEVVCQILAHVSPGGLVKNVWDQLSEANKDILKDYTRLLIKTLEGVTPTEKKYSPTILKIFNHVFQELLKDTKLESVQSTVDEILRTHGDTTDHIYDSIHPSLQPFRFPTEQMMSVIMNPPSESDYRKMLQDDKTKATDSQILPFSKDVTFPQLFDKIENAEAFSAWYHLKLVEMINSNCPPEFMVIVEQMVDVLFSQWKDGTVDT